MGVSSNDDKSRSRKFYWDKNYKKYRLHYDINRVGAANIKANTVSTIGSNFNDRKLDNSIYSG